MSTESELSKYPLEYELQDDSSVREWLGQYKTKLRAIKAHRQMKLIFRSIKRTHKSK